MGVQGCGGAVGMQRCDGVVWGVGVQGFVVLASTRFNAPCWFLNVFDGRCFFLLNVLESTFAGVVLLIPWE